MHSSLGNMYRWSVLHYTTYIPESNALRKMRGTTRRSCLCILIHTSPLPILDQALVVQFNSTDDPLQPSTSVHVKCIAAVALVTGAAFNFSSLSTGLDSRLPVPTGVVDVVAGVIDVLEGVVGGFAC